MILVQGVEPNILRELALAHAQEINQPCGCAYIHGGHSRKRRGQKKLGASLTSASRRKRMTATNGVSVREFAVAAGDNPGSKRHQASRVKGCCTTHIFTAAAVQTWSRHEDNSLALTYRSRILVARCQWARIRDNSKLTSASKTRDDLCIEQSMRTST